jgi:uncharacterized membrane protein
MESIISLDLLLRWLHVAFGIVWIGMLYYFNFVQMEYFKVAQADSKADALKNLAPRALFYFRWGAFFTFLTGVFLIEIIRQGHGVNSFITLGATLGTIMFLNVWLVIWPNQKIVIGLAEGDKAAAGAKAGLASRTNTLFSGPMLLGMMGSFHGAGNASYALMGNAANANASTTGLLIALAIVALLEINALKGKMGPLTSIVGVIHCSLALTIVFFGLLQFL